ncbi:MAG: dTMP kinase [Candidatus Nomurabacteria bacterium]|jgi:dTMP kinase|nr:dTMP kinase [Candidatus Nomurabacteria bacterium]
MTASAKKSQKSGLYIVIEGQDGTGKTTQVNLLAQYFADQGREVTTFDEPAGLPSTDAMRDIIKNKDLDLDGTTQLLLFTAARNELWKKKAEPVLARGGVVLTSRNWWSTLAYQGYGQGVKLEKIKQITRKLLPKHYVEPDKAVILVLSEKERIKRMQKRDQNSKKDTFESKPSEFQMKVNQGYETIASELKIPVVDASATIDEVHANICKNIINML